MKKIVLFAILLQAGLEATAQNKLGLFNIRGEKVEIPDSVQPLVIFYSTYSCHNCMNELIDYVEQLKHDNHRFKIYVMIPGRDVATMRYVTTGLDEFFNKKNMPMVVYDLNKDTSLRFETQYDVKYYPCLFIFDLNGKCHYLNYGILFMEGASVSKKKNKMIEEL